MTISDRTKAPMTTAQINGPTMVKKGEVRQVRELKRGVQAQVCLGASAVHGSAVVVVESHSPAVMAALESLRAALRADALAIYRDIQEAADHA